MMKTNNIFNTMTQRPLSVAKYSTSEAVRELNKRKQAAREAALKAVAEKAERDKQRLRAAMSEDAILGITYVPFVIAEVAWDYADSILNLAVIMRLSETRKLCRAIKELRQEYNYNRFQIINSDWRENETENMIMFQEELSDFFSETYRTIKEALKQEHEDLSENSLMLIGSVYQCRMVIKALKRYTEAQEKVVAAVLGYEIKQILPKEIDKLNMLIIEFVGDSPLPKAYDAKLAAYAEDLAKYIADIGFTSDKGQNKEETKIKTNNLITQQSNHTTMTNEELFNEIQSQLVIFNNELVKNIKKGNKAAGVRARKASLELEKLMKQYRKQSVNTSK